MPKLRIMTTLALAIIASPLHGTLLPSAATAGELVTLVGGCHADIRVGMVRELGRSARHYHRGPDCETFVVETRSSDRRYYDCHRDARTHRVNGVMLRHRHVGPNCEIREVRSSTSSSSN